MLLHAQDEDGSRMTDRQLRDEVIRLLLAGHETTALALSWAWWLLAQHPQAEAKLHAELNSVLGGRTPALENLPKLRYLDHVITESMRLYPPAWGMARLAIEDAEIGGGVIFERGGGCVFPCGGDPQPRRGRASAGILARRRGGGSVYWGRR